MPSLCGYCEGRVPYFGRRFAHHRWFCSQDCLTHWEAEPRHAEVAAQPTTTNQRLPWIVILLAGVIGFGLVAALAVMLMAVLSIMAHPNLGTAFRYEREAEQLLRAGREGEAAEKYMAAANIYRDRDLFSAAGEAYSSVLRLSPDEAGAYNGRGYAYLNLAKYHLAEADFQRAIDLEPGFVAAYANRGLARAMLGDAGGAIADFDKELSLSTDPEYDAGWLIDELEELESRTSDPGITVALEAIIKHLKDR